VVLPRAAFGAGQAVIGVALGAYMKVSALDALGSHWLAVTVVSAATLGLTLVAGARLARVADVDAPTAAPEIRRRASDRLFYGWITNATSSSKQ
jgi:uncharacterized protein